MEKAHTKNDGSSREVNMSSLVHDTLLEQQQITGSGEYVFINKKGNPLENGNLTKRIWYPTLEKIGLEKRRPYQTRHTCASLWLASGESPEWISAQLGHATTSMLFKVYSRYVPDLVRQDGQIFESFLTQQYPHTKH